jgi:hypothetical protein
MGALVAKPQKCCNSNISYFHQVALGLLTTKSGSSEDKLYENIVEIPHYHSKNQEI